MSHTVKIPDTVHEKAKEVSKERDATLGEAIRLMCRDGGYDV